MELPASRDAGVIRSNDPIQTTTTATITLVREILATAHTQLACACVTNTKLSESTGRIPEGIRPAGHDWPGAGTVRRAAGREIPEDANHRRPRPGAVA